MIRYFILCLIFWAILIGIPAAVAADSIKGSMQVTGIDAGKKKTEDVEFIISGDQARINTTYSIYYVVELDTERAFLVNPRRKTVTAMYAKDILNHSLPPLVILKNKSSIKNYLASTNAKLENDISNGSSKYELWRFTLEDVYYTVKIKLPEYFPEEVEISSKDSKTTIIIKDKQYISDQTLASDYFVIPQHYKLLDLLEK
jgi:hypothetical protein